jgi:hypothetical protein
MHAFVQHVKISQFFRMNMHLLTISENVKKNLPLNSGSKIVSEYITKSLQHEFQTLFNDSNCVTPYPWRCPNRLCAWPRAQMPQTTRSDPICSPSQILPATDQICHTPTGSILQKASPSGASLLQAVSTTSRLLWPSEWRISSL